MERGVIIIISQGTVYYDQYTRTRNVIRLKKKIMNMFGDLPKSQELFYRAELCPDYNSLLSRVQELRNTNEQIPILLFLSK